MRWMRQSTLEIRGGCGNPPHPFGKDRLRRRECRARTECSDVALPDNDAATARSVVAARSGPPPHACDPLLRSRALRRSFAQASAISAQVTDSGTSWAKLAQLGLSNGPVYAGSHSPDSRAQTTSAGPTMGLGRPGPSPGPRPTPALPGPDPRCPRSPTRPSSAVGRAPP